MYLFVSLTVIQTWLKGTSYIPEGSYLYQTLSHCLATTWQQAKMTLVIPYKNIVSFLFYFILFKTIKP